MKTKKVITGLLTLVLTLVTVLSVPLVTKMQVSAEAVTPKSGNIYYIKNKNSGMYLQVAGDSSKVGANVCQSKGTGSLGQRWIVNFNSDGSCRLHPATDMTGGLCLDVYNGKSDNLTNIQIWGSNGHPCQNYKLSSNGDGSFAILTGASSYKKCLDVINFSKDSGANVIQYDAKYTANQLWYFEPAPWPTTSNSTSNNSSANTSSATIPLNNNGYPEQKMLFVNAQNGGYLAAAANSNNTNVKSASDDDLLSQWKLVKKGADYYQIVNASSGYVLAPKNNSASNGAALVATGNTSNKAQYWKLSAVSKDKQGNVLYYALVNCANTNYAVTLNGSSFTLSKYNASGNQCFRVNSYGAEGFAGYAKDMNGQEKASVTGGALGDVVYVSDLNALQQYAQGTTPYTIVINKNISKNTLTKVNVGKNKTIIGSFGNHELSNIHFRCISNSGNVIFKNITFKHDASINGNDDIQMYISNGNNFWVDHCTFQGHTSYKSNDVDKHMYVGLNADFVSVTGCVFGGHKYGLILGYPQDSNGSAYRGYPRMTIANNYFYNCYTRAPGLMRYGYFHSYNNFVYGFHLGYTPYTECNVYSERNYFDKGAYAGRVVDDYGAGKFTDVGSVLTSSVSNLKTPGTSWRPITNYSYGTRDAYSARSWCQKYCGSQNSNIVYAID